MADFGETGTSGSGNSTLLDTVNGIHNPAPASSGDLTSISCYVTITLGRGNEFYMKAALYTVSGTTYTFVGETNERHFGGLGEVPGSGFLWKQFDFASALPITGGTPYALMVWAGNGTPTVCNLKYDTSGTYGITINGHTYNDFPTPYTQTPAGIYPSIYGTYTPTVAGPPLDLASAGMGR